MKWIQCQIINIFSYFCKSCRFTTLWFPFCYLDKVPSINTQLYIVHLYDRIVGILYECQDPIECRVNKGRTSFLLEN